MAADDQLGLDVAFLGQPFADLGTNYYDTHDTSLDQVYQAAPLTLTGTQPHTCAVATSQGQRAAGVIPGTLVYPLTYDEADRDGLNALTRQGYGPHITPDGMFCDGERSRYKLTALPSWLSSSSGSVSLHALVTAERQNKNATRDTIVALGDDDANRYPKAEICVLTDGSDVSGPANIGFANRAAGVITTRYFGRSTWRYATRWPVAHELSGANNALMQTAVFLDADTIVVFGHYEDTESRAYKIDIATQAVLGTFTFGTTTFRHVAASAMRANGDFWLTDYETGHALRVDLAASFAAGTAVITADWNLTNIGVGTIGSIEFITVSGTEYVLICQYKTSGTVYLYAIPVAEMVDGTTFAIANRYKRFAVALRVQGIRVRSADGLLYAPTSANGGLVLAYDISTAITSSADGAILTAVRSHYGPSQAVEDILFHPTTGEAWIATEGRGGAGDNTHFSAFWRSPMTDNLPLERKVVIDYDGAGTYTFTLDDVWFGTLASTPTLTSDCLTIGGPPAASAGSTNGYFGGTVRAVAFKNSPFDATEIAELADAAYEAESLVAHSITLTNPGAESGTAGWTNETGSIATTSTNVRYEEGVTNTAYFYGGANLATVARQRLDLAAATGLSTATIDAEIAAGTIWATLSWWQSNFDALNDPGTMGLRYLDGTPTQISATYAESYINQTAWRKRFLAVSVPTGARHIDLLQKFDRTGGTNNDTRIDDIVLTVYRQVPTTATTAQAQTSAASVVVSSSFTVSSSQAQAASAAVLAASGADANVAMSQAQSVTAQAAVAAAFDVAGAQAQSSAASVQLASSVTTSTANAQQVAAQALVSWGVASASAQAQGATATAAVSVAASVTNRQGQSSSAQAGVAASTQVAASQVQSAAAQGGGISNLAVASSQVQVVQGAAQVVLQAAAAGSQAQCAAGVMQPAMSVAAATSQAQQAAAQAGQALSFTVAAAQGQRAFGSAGVTLAASADTKQGQRASATAQGVTSASTASRQGQSAAGELASAAAPDGVISTRQGQSAAAQGALAVSVAVASWQGQRIGAQASAGVAAIVAASQAQAAAASAALGAPVAVQTYGGQRTFVLAGVSAAASIGSRQAQRAAGQLGLRSDASVATRQGQRTAAQVQLATGQSLTTSQVQRALGSASAETRFTVAASQAQRVTAFYGVVGSVSVATAQAQHIGNTTFAAPGTVAVVSTGQSQQSATGTLVIDLPVTGRLAAQIRIKPVLAGVAGKYEVLTAGAQLGATLAGEADTHAAVSASPKILAAMSARIELRPSP